MKRTTKSVLVFALTASMVFSNAGAGSAKAKKPKLSKSKVTITVGKKATIKVKKVKPKKTTWSLTKKGKKIVSLSKKKKTSVTIKGKKKGKATLTAKIKVGKKTYKKKVKITVKKKTTPPSKPTPTPPVNNPTPTPTAPVGSGTPSTTAPATDVPSTTAPATDVPSTTAPATDVPSTTAPATDVPSTTAPASDDPTDTPAPNKGEMDLSSGLDNSNLSGAIDDDGNLVADKGMQTGIKMPSGVKAGEEYIIKVTGSYTDDETLRSFISNEAMGAVSGVAYTSDAANYDKTNIVWVYKLTVTQDADPAYILIKGPTGGVAMKGVLTIKSIEILDEMPVGPSDQPSASPSATPETQVIDPIVGEKNVSYAALDATDDYFVTATGKTVSTSAKDIAELAKVFDTASVLAKWNSDVNEIVKDFDNGTTVTAIKDEDEENAAKRTVVVADNGEVKTYAVEMEEVANGIKLTVQKADSETVDTIEVTDSTVTVTRGDAQIAVITKGADGSYSVDVDKAWYTDNGLVLKKVVKQGPPTPPGPGETDTPAPGTDDPATTAPGTTAPGTDDPATTAPTTTAPGTTAPGTTAPGTDDPTDTPKPTDTQKPTDEPTPSPVPDLVLQGEDLGAGADFTYAGGAGQYATIAEVELPGDKISTNPKISLEWVTKDADDNVQTYTKINVTARKNNPGYVADGSNHIAANYQVGANATATGIDMTLGADKVGSLTADDKVYLIVATSEAGFSGKFEVTKVKLDDVEVTPTSLSDPYVYTETGMDQYQPTAKVNLPTTIDFSLYKTCEIEYEISDPSFTNYYGIVANTVPKDNGEGNVEDCDFNSKSGTMTITLDKVKAGPAKNPYVTINTNKAGFKGSVKITKITFVADNDKK